MRFDDLPREWASARINGMHADELRAMTPVELQRELSDLLDEQSQRIVAWQASQIRAPQSDRWEVAIDSARVRVKRFMADLAVMAGPINEHMREVFVIEDFVVNEISLIPRGVSSMRIKPEYHSGGADDE